MFFEFSLTGVLTALFRRMRVFSLVALLVVFAGGSYLWHLPPVYESKGSLLVRLGQGALPTVGTGDERKAPEYTRDDREEIIQSDVMLLLSDDVLKEVIGAVGLEEIYPGTTAGLKGAGAAEEAAVRRLRDKDLKVWADPKSDIIGISARNGDPAVAQKIVARLMDVFTARQSVIFGVPQTAFLGQQADAMRLKMDQSQQDLRDFKSKEGITLLDEEVTQLLAEKRDLSVHAFQSVGDLQIALAKLQNDYATLESTYRPDSPVLSRANHGLAVARAELEQRNAGEGGLARRIAAIDARLALLETNRKHYDELRQRVTLDAENYKLYELRNEEARVDDRLNQENITRVSIMDRPVVPLKPVDRNRALLLAAILVAALFLSLGAALALELLDDKVVFTHKITEVTGLPLLAFFER